MDNRPHGREKHITGTGKPIEKKGSGLHSGPVGRTGGMPHSSTGGRVSSGQTRASGGGGGLIKILLIGALLLGGGGAGITGLLGGFGGGSAQPAYPSYPQVTQAPVQPQQNITQPVAPFPSVCLVF